MKSILEGIALDSISAPPTAEVEKGEEAEGGVATINDDDTTQIPEEVQNLLQEHLSELSIYMCLAH